MKNIYWVNVSNRNRSFLTRSLIRWLIYNLSVYGVCVFTNVCATWPNRYSLLSGAHTRANTLYTHIIISLHC